MTIINVMSLIMFLCVLALVVIIWKQADVIAKQRTEISAKDFNINCLKDDIDYHRREIVSYNGINKELMGRNLELNELNNKIRNDIGVFDERYRTIDLEKREMQKEIDALLVKLAGHVTRTPKPWTDKGT